MEEQGIERKVVLFFGTRSRKDLVSMEELKGMEGRLPWFTFVPVLSRELNRRTPRGKGQGAG